jgi:hypothetical protein
MTPIKPKPPGYKPSPLQKAKMAGHFKNKIQQIITGGPRTVPGQTLVGPAPKPAGYGAKPAIPTPVSGPPSNAADPTQKIANYRAQGMKKGGTTTLHSITKSSKKSNW